jgi:hypothetical protein
MALAACSGMSALTEKSLRDAEEKWVMSKVMSYRLVVEMEGDRVAREEFEVVVRDGAVESLKRNGQATSAADREEYSMNGLFRTLHREMSLAEKPTVLGAPAGYSAYLMARFDEKTGRLMRYRRTVGGASNTINITVKSFEPQTEERARP